MIRKPKEEPQEPKLEGRRVFAAIIGDSNTLIEDFDTHLDELRRRGYSETLIEEFRLRFNIGNGEPS